MSEIFVSELIKVLEKLKEEHNNVINLKIGSGNKEYDLADILASPISNKVVFATQSFAEKKG